MASEVIGARSPGGFSPTELRTRHLSENQVEVWAMEEIQRIVLEAIGSRSIDAYLFGSRARGDFRSSSDIDLAVEARDHSISINWLAELREKLELSLIPYHVEIIDLSHASPGLVEAIREEGIKWT